MRKLGFIKRALVVVTLGAFAAPQAEAIEIFGGPNPAAHMSDDLLTQVRGGGGRGGGGHRHGGGGMHRRRRHAPGRHAWRRHAPWGHEQAGRRSRRDAPSGRRIRWTRKHQPGERQPERESERKSQRQPKRQRQPRGLRLSRRRLGRTSRLVSLAGRRRDRGRSGDRLRRRGGGGLVGRRAAGVGLMLVLHRPQPPPGLLGPMPVTRETPSPVHGRGLG